MCLLLNYNVNGSPMIQGAYQEIELQINKQDVFNSIKKTLSGGSIIWGDVTYVDDEGTQQTFTGYYTNLSQEETFSLSSGDVNVQLRVMINNEVGSSAISEINVGQVLSKKVLNATTN